MEQTVKKTCGLCRNIRYLLLAIVMMGGAYYAWSWNYFYREAPERVGKDMTYLWQWKMYAKGMKEAYANDTYGGATPEETLALFVDALKAGNIDLAAKYYIPEKQEEVYGDLAKGRENGSLVKTAEVYATAAFPKQTSEIEYFMSVVDATYSFDIVFNKNTFSQKWKIAAP